VLLLFLSRQDGLFFKQLSSFLSEWVPLYNYSSTNKQQQQQQRSSRPSGVLGGSSTGTSTSTGRVPPVPSTLGSAYGSVDASLLRSGPGIAGTAGKRERLL
jgi:hypothetical protein